MGSELRLYEVTVGRHKTRMRLNDHDAEAMGDAAVYVPEPPSPQPAAPPPDPLAGKSRLVTSNKMRGTGEPSAHNERGAN